MAQGLIETAQTIDVGHHQLILAGLDQLLPGAGKEGAAIEETRQPVEVGGCEFRFQGDDTGGAQPVLEPDAAPDAGL